MTLETPDWLSIFTSAILLVNVRDIYAYLEIVLLVSGRWFAEIRTYKVQQEFEKHTE